MQQMSSAQIGQLFRFKTNLSTYYVCSNMSTLPIFISMVKRQLNISFMSALLLKSVIYYTKHLSLKKEQLCQHHLCQLSY